MLSTVFVDYDNIYLSLKRKSEEAAKKFAKDSSSWLGAIESGALLTTTNGQPLETKRRLVMSRCYGNPVPRRNSHDNATDMNSFPFVRHHYLRSGFEVIDCPPLTAQLKNSADIRMVMDIRDLLTHQTYFDEFIILSGDADFTPLLHRLRAHARRTVVFANDYTAAPYTAICDGEVRESDLIRLLVEGKLPGEVDTPKIENKPNEAHLAELRREIIAEVTNTARVAGQPIPLESLADRAVRTLGHEKTVGSAWGGAGSFRELLSTNLTGDIRLSAQPPYFVYDASREVEADKAAAQIAHQAPTSQQSPIVPQEPILEHLPTFTGQPPAPEFNTNAPAPVAPGQQHTGIPARGIPALESPQAHSQSNLPQGSPTEPQAPLSHAPQQQSYNTPVGKNPQQLPEAKPGLTFDTPFPGSQPTGAPVDRQERSGPTANARSTQAQADTGPTEIQESIARIHEACQAPPLSPPEYRILFEAIAHEITHKGLLGIQTLENIAELLREAGIEARIDDIRFVIEVISESDPWFEQGKSANLFASRFRNFVVARCRTQGLALTADEVDLIDAWFLAPVKAPAVEKRTPQQQQPQTKYSPPQHLQSQPQQIAPLSQQAPVTAETPYSQQSQAPAQQHHQTAEPVANNTGGGRWWNRDPAAQAASQPQSSSDDAFNAQYGEPQSDRENATEDDFPRIVRGRMRG